LVPLVEEGWFDHPATEMVASEYLAPLRDDGVRAVVLGCTHYPLLRPLLQRIMGPGVTLIDSGEATAESLQNVLRDKGLAAPEGADAWHRFVVSDDEARFRLVGARFIGERLGEAEVVPLG
jgi:glutamate racemase